MVSMASFGPGVKTMRSVLMLFHSPFLEKAPFVPILVDQKAQHSEWGLTALPESHACQAVLPGRYLNRQFSAVFLMPSSASGP